MPSLHLTVLGSGTSMGVPTIGCECRVCRSTDPRDSRLRPSVLLRFSDGSAPLTTCRNILIDTTPDFRAQALRHRLKSLDAVIFTHGHADHILGLDDIRPFNLRQGDIPVYANEETLGILQRTFAYIFSGTPTESTVPGVTLNRIDGPLDLFGLALVPVPARHGEMDVLGFRFGRAAYLTDFSAVPESSKPLLRDLDDLILDALRYTPHPMHSSVDQSLALVDELRPRRAWFTHICHDLAHEETNARLAEHGFPHVQLAYDGLTFEVQL